MAEQLANNAASTLNGAIDNIVGSLVVANGAVFPSSGNFRLIIDSELLLCTARSTNTLTVTRGIESSSAASHSNGAVVTHVLTKGGFDQYLSDNVLTQILAQSALIVPPATVVPYAGSSAPTNWLLCDGAAVSRTTYATLFGIISTVYGTGDGSTTFNVPDLRGRVSVGKGTNTAVDALNKNDGVTVANRRPQHRHTAHSHTTNAFDGGVSAFHVRAQSTDTSQGNFATSSVDGGSGNASDSLDAPAFLVLNYIIKT